MNPRRHPDNQMELSTAVVDWRLEEDTGSAGHTPWQRLCLDATVDATVHWDSYEGRAPAEEVGAAVQGLKVLHSASQQSDLAFVLPVVTLLNFYFTSLLFAHSFLWRTYVQRDLVQSELMSCLRVYAAETTWLSITGMSSTKDA
jgi:hypothetical protein